MQQYKELIHARLYCFMTQNKCQRLDVWGFWHCHMVECVKEKKEKNFFFLFPLSIVKFCLFFHASKKHLYNLPVFLQPEFSFSHTPE